MKIAILVSNFSKFAGDARVAELQVKELIEAGNQVAVFTLKAEINFEPEGAELFVLGMPENLLWQRIYRIFFPLDLAKTIKWLPKLKNFDLIIAHLYPMSWLAFLAKKFYEVNYTFWYHGIPSPEYFPKLREKIFLLMYKFLTKITVQNVDRAVSVSKYTRGELKKYTGIDSEVVYNKPDTRRYYKGIDGTGIRAKYDLDEAPVILYVGQISPRKSVHLLVKAFNILKQKIPDAKLVIVGRESFNYYSRELREMCDNSVIFAGYVSDEELPQYYAMCDVYATCSLWEANNVPVIEVQACGKPAIAFDFEFFKEEVDENGILVEAGNVEKFAQACIEKLKHVRETH